MDKVIDAINTAIDALEAIEDLVPDGDMYDMFLNVVHRLEDLRDEAEA